MRIAVQADEVYKRSFWTESFVQWSPHGSYLATMHRQGIALWGGPSFSRLHRFSHPNVRHPEPYHPTALRLCGCEAQRRRAGRVSRALRGCPLRAPRTCMCLALGY